MKCDKCNQDFLEKELECSHDIPKWLGGEDIDGRHWLCKKCHIEYENEVMRFVFMNFIKDTKEKEKYKWCAKLVRHWFYKNNKKEEGIDGDTKTITTERN